MPSCVMTSKLQVINFILPLILVYFLGTYIVSMIGSCSTVKSDPVKDTLFLFRRPFFSLNRGFGAAEIFNEVLDRIASMGLREPEGIAGQQHLGILRAPSSG